MPHTHHLPRMAVGLSGGIDSAVTALLLKEQGYEVIGVTLRLRACGDADSQPKSCCGPDAAGMAGSVAAQLGIRHYVVDCREHFEQAVLRPCWEDFERGATPNPCVRCNADVRFDELLAIGRKLGAECVATGHYACLQFDEQDRPRLLRGADQNKDQSYFLYALAPETLRQVRFPLGGMTKPGVRALAQAHGLVNAERAESQDVCFAGPEGHFAEYLCRQFHGRATPGVFVDEAGRVLGRHAGIHSFTIGQRRGLGFATGERVKVIAVDPATGTIIVSDRPEAACSAACRAEAFRWHREPLAAGGRAMAQVRYRQKAVTAIIESIGDDGRAVHVRFDEPVFGVTPGQSLVLYDGDLVLGGGRIVRE
ncbi:MAG: tRNA 2-thiouridine(34) synthase MnmA [bacterium]